MFFSQSLYLQHDGEEENETLNHSHMYLLTINGASVEHLILKTTLFLAGLFKKLEI